MAKLRIDKREVYIEPVSSCNLTCKLCYANVINGKKSQFISKDDILSFVDEFYKFKNKRFKIYWCGTGEIFLHKDFPQIINTINHKYKDKINHTVMTNGTIDRFKEFDKLNNIEFYVSIDGPKESHEWNRGLGTYEKSIDFCKKAVSLGCKKIEIRTLITKMNIYFLKDWEKELKKNIGNSVKLSLISPYRTKDVCKQNSLVMKKKINYDCCILSRNEIKRIFKRKFPKKFFGLIEENQTTYLSTCLNYNGVYNCCEATIKIGDINTPMSIIQKNLINSKAKCISCPLYSTCLN